MREHNEGVDEQAETMEGIAELDELLASLEPPSPGATDAVEAEPTVPGRPEPVGYVTRELEGPDGSVVRVEVPVFAAADGQGPDVEPEKAETDDDAAPVTEDLDVLLAAEDADDT